jgi:hypothetical protein
MQELNVVWLWLNKKLETIKDGFKQNTKSLLPQIVALGPCIHVLRCKMSPKVSGNPGFVQGAVLLERLSIPRGLMRQNKRDIAYLRRLSLLKASAARIHPLNQLGRIAIHNSASIKDLW